MNWQRIRTIIVKEIDEAIRNRSVSATYLLVLGLFTLMPLVIAFVIPAISGAEAIEDSDMAPMAELLTQAYPAFASLSLVQQFQVFILRQFIVLFMIQPIMGAMSISTYSIIGEKTSRSLEALLATPIRTDELLLGKSIAAAVPAVLGTWISFSLYALAVRLLGGPEVFRHAVDSTAWAIMFLITPAVALLGLGLGVIVSSRATDPRGAQQVGSLVVIPIVVIMISQTAGLFLLGLPLVIIGATILFIIDVVLLQVGVRLFDRERILTRWT